MSTTADFLVELGCEELPPKALRKLSDAFQAGLVTGLHAANLTHGDVLAFCTPRRLAVWVQDLQTSQADRSEQKLGPNVAAAVDKDGNPSQAAIGFARSCGVDVDALERVATDKGERLAYQSHETGQAADELLAGIVQTALDRLPIPKRMRWGDSDTQFVRPVHWLMMLLGESVVSGEVLGLKAGNISFGHRFHAPAAISLSNPADYVGQLLAANVIVDFEARRQRVLEMVETAGRNAGGAARIDADLLDEVTALVEWPAPIIGSFDERFLEMPPEVIVATIQDHQRYFPVVNADNQLLPRFITISNLESPEPELIVAGNERVVRPRLEDALFFWNQDRKQSLADLQAGLGNVVYQRELGTQADKTARVAELARQLAETLDADGDAAIRAAELSRCDLLTHMVAELPELQGIMGRYYAELDGEPEAVSAAIAEQYKPRFSGDELPASMTGLILALAERLDTLAGIFAIGKKPSGDKDPYGLRRAALGVLRICLERKLPLNLDDWLKTAIAAQPVSHDDAAEALLGFLRDRLRVIFRDSGHTGDRIEAVLASACFNPADLAQRLLALEDFLGSPEAQTLAAANKRIANILAKVDPADWNQPADQEPTQLIEAAELQLQTEVTEAASRLSGLLSQHDYSAILSSLAPLSSPINQFFEDVLVNAEDPALRRLRLSLLRDLRGLFLSVADFSLIQTSD